MLNRVKLQRDFNEKSFDIQVKSPQQVHSNKQIGKYPDYVIEAHSKEQHEQNLTHYRDLYNQLY